MPSTYVGKTGKTYLSIEPALGKGGEGSVFRISGMPDYVLKIFADTKRTETRHRKLLAMISTPLSPSAMQQITWPVDVVYQNNQFVGYVMPIIRNNEELNVMYSDKYTCTLSEKITIAKNLCAAINAVHNAGHICGDLNPKNIVVDPNNAKVTLVDTDSYHITEKNGARVYRCEVGCPEYLPREIQEKMKNGQTLATAVLPTFSKQSDLFALAVHIFALLMNGCHPFACAVNNKPNIMQLSASQPSVAAPQPIDNICSGYFPFYTKKVGITTPRYAPTFDSLPTNIQALFVRAFVDGHSNPNKRPDSVEWYSALSDFQQNLSICKKDKTHMYSSHLTKCPWCAVEDNMKKPIIVQPVITNATNTTSVTPVVQTQTQTQQTFGGTNTVSSNSIRSDGIMASSGMFWFLTLAITLGAQALIQGIWGNQIVGEIFGYRYGSGIESWGVNLAVALGPWGFVICGLIGTCCYNSMWCNNGKLYGYKPSHYILSCIVSFVFSVAWILFILILSLVIMILAIVFVIAIVCGGLSGS